MGKEKEFMEVINRNKSGIIWVSAIVLFIVGIMYFGTRINVDYDEIPVMIDAKEYIGLSEEDVLAKLGEPDEIGDFNQYIYYFDDYKLKFNFKNYHIFCIYIIPNEPIMYKKSLQEGFYMLGLGDEFREFKYNGRSTYDRIGDIEAGDIELIDFYWYSDDESVPSVNYIEKITIGYSKLLPEKEVFEGDFSDVEVVLDLAKYLGVNKNEIFATFGEPKSPEDANENGVVYYLDIGELIFSYKGTNEVQIIYLKLAEPMKYEESVQEGMVMFGVDPNKQDIELYAIEEDLEIYNNVYDENDTMEIRGIDRENKTFWSVYIN